MRRAGVRGFEMSVVIPDDSSRIALGDCGEPGGQGRRTRSIPQVEAEEERSLRRGSAQIAYQVLGPHEGTEEKGVDVMVALSPRSIIQEYEDLLEKLDIHAGYVMPSTIAAMNLRPERRRQATGRKMCCS